MVFSTLCVLIPVCKRRTSFLHSKTFMPEILHCSLFSVRNMSKRNISYVASEEPDFIKKFKQKVGYKEGPTIDSKRAELEQEDSDQEEPDDERPTVVVLRKGDLTAEEAERHAQSLEGNIAQQDEDEMPPDGRIMFKKPTKKSYDERASELNVSTNKTDKHKKELNEKLNKDRKKVKKVKNTKLLSFNEDEEEEDDG